jgi:uncharacterized membrane protein
MDPRLRRRITMFYAAGAVNVFLGLYVLVEGPAFLERETVTWLTIFFIVFAAIDFWFPYQMKKKWEQEQAILKPRHPPVDKT